MNTIKDLIAENQIAIIGGIITGTVGAFMSGYIARKFNAATEARLNEMSKPAPQPTTN